MDISSSELAMQTVTREKVRSGDEIPSFTTSAAVEETLKEFAAAQEKENNPNGEQKPAAVADPEKPEQEPESVAVPEEGPPEGVLPDTEQEEVTPDRKRFELLAKRDRQLREREQRVKNRPGEDMETLQAAAKANPIEFLRKFGLTYQDVANKLIEDPSLADPVKDRGGDPALLERLQVVETQLAEQRQATNARQYNSSMKTLLDEIQNFVETKGDTYSLVKARGDYPMVADLMQRYYDNTIDQTTGVGKVMSYDQAASQIENYLMDQARQYVGTEKIAALFANKATTQEAPTENTGPRKTLTQEASAMPQKSSADERPDDMTREQSLDWIARNIKLFD